MSQAAIEFEHVGKGYHLGAYRRSLREALGGMLRPRAAANPTDLFWALDDVSFQVLPGEVLGIIGHNGAGKSTILKLLSEVTYPTRGRIHTRGRMAALIELGAGFHPDLSGRDNIFLNGSILGLKRREIAAQFDEIVAFAELEKFIDTPVKRYSSGMYVRLAFAVAAHVKADILVVDEVLSVGDAAFQQKSLDKMLEMRDRGTTIVFVSHNLWSVATFCQRVLLLDSGHIVADGLPGLIIQQYRETERAKKLARSTVARELTGERAIITQIELGADSGQAQTEWQPQSAFTMRVHYKTFAPIDTPVVKIYLRRADGLVCLVLRSPMPTIGPIGHIQVHLPAIQLVPDVYTIEVSLISGRKPATYATYSGTTFTVIGQADTYDQSGVFQPPVAWHFTA